MGKFPSWLSLSLGAVLCPSNAGSIVQSGALAIGGLVSRLFVVSD